MQRNIAIQTYKGATDKTGNKTLVHIVIELIQKSGPLEKRIRELRELKYTNDSNAAALLDREKGNTGFETYVKEFQQRYDDLKKKLPAVTWSGTFEKRKAEAIVEYSGLLCIDIDKLSPAEAQSLKSKVCGDPHTFFCFISPSGTGLKTIFQVTGGKDQHLGNFKAIEKYFHDTYSVKVDPSGKDVCRLCFLSFDKDAYINWSSAIFDGSKISDDGDLSAGSDSGNRPVVNLSDKEKKLLEKTDEDFDSIRTFTDNKLTYSEGSRNNYVHLLACNFNRKGIDINECLNYILSFATDLKQSEIVASIKSAYDHNAYEHGKFKRKNRPETKGGNVATAANVSGKKLGNGHAPNEANDYVQFWWVSKDEKRNDEKGDPLIRYNLVYNKLIQFLEEHGFYRLLLMNNTYQYIRYRDNVCEPVHLIHMKDCVFGWLNEKNYTGVLEMMRRGAKSYFVNHVTDGLGYKAIDFKVDTQKEAFYYFRNCVVRVTAENIETAPITELQGAVWKTSIINRDFTLQHLQLPIKKDGSWELDKFNCEMAKYIALVSHNPKSEEEVTPEVINGRFNSLCSSIGYMLHGWKSRVGKAIVAVDHKVPEDKTEQNGGTGKSIVGESFKYLKCTTVIDGREFKEDYPFRFEMIGVDTKIVVMQDCKYQLDFGSFFVPITNDFTFNRRFSGFIMLPFADSPKWWFDTNFVFKGEGASFRRRMHVIEFDDYFDENHTPYDEFGHYLFQDWNAEQWNLFYNFYFECVSLYLKNGLMDYPQSNYDNRKLIVEAPQEFIDFIDAKDDKTKVYIHARRNHWIEKKELLKTWNEEAKSLNMQGSTPHQFSKWMKKYCIARPFVLHKKKTNGKELYMLAEKGFKPSDPSLQSGNLFESNFKRTKMNKDDDDNTMPFPVDNK